MSRNVGIEITGLSIVSGRRDNYSGLTHDSLERSAYYLNNVDLSFRENDKVFLRGATGREKIALVRALAGMLPYGKGSIEIKGNFLPGVVPSFGMMPRATMQQNARLRGLRLGFSGSLLNKYCEKIFSDPYLAHRREIDLLDLKQDTLIAFWLATLAEIRPDIFLIESWMNPSSKELSKRCRELFIKRVDESVISVIAIDNVSLASQASNVEIEFSEGKVHSYERLTNSSE